MALAGRRREVVQPFDLPALSSTWSAAVFSSTRATRLVPGIGAMSSPCASSQASATYAGVASASVATALTSSTMSRSRWRHTSNNTGLISTFSVISCNVTSTALARDLATVRNFTVACYAFPIG